MARVKDILNNWGKQGGLNPQRSDLWQVDLSEAISGLNGIADIFPHLDDLPRYYHASVALPELKVKAEVIRRDSRSYNMPSWDEPLESIRMNFIVDDGGKAVSPSDVSQSTIYTLLDLWRSVVRAGRGAVGAEPTIALDANFRINYAFPVYVYLLKGQEFPKANASTTQTSAPPESTRARTFEDGSESQTQSTQVDQTPLFTQFMQQTGLDVSGVLRLENTWLSSFRVNELAYERSGILIIEATFYADNILQDRRTNQTQ